MDLHYAMWGHAKVCLPLYKPLSLCYRRISPKFEGERKTAIVFPPKSFPFSSLNISPSPSLQVGFLKTQHRYEIVFTLPEVPALGKDVCPARVPSPHLRITDITPAPEGEIKNQTWINTAEFASKRSSLKYKIYKELLYCSISSGKVTTFSC